MMLPTETPAAVCEMCGKNESTGMIAYRLLVCEVCAEGDGIDRRKEQQEYADWIEHLGETTITDSDLHFEGQRRYGK